MLLETIRETNVCPKHEVVPRVVGTSIPHHDSDPESYFLFMLAHFSPFSADHDVIFEGGNLEAIFTGDNWISYQGASDSSSNRDVLLSHGQEKYPFHCLKLWQDEIKQAEQMISHARCARDDPHNQIVMKDVCQETSNSVNLEQISTGDGLPPHLDLYIGAPVVLRNRNLSQELRITNGAQGIVRGIFSEE